MQDTFAARPNARATIGYLVYKILSHLVAPEKIEYFDQNRHQNDAWLYALPVFPNSCLRNDYQKLCQVVWFLLLGL